MALTEEQQDALVARILEVAGQPKRSGSGTRYMEQHGVGELAEGVEKLTDLAAKLAITGSPFNYINRRVFRMGGTG